LLEPEPGRAYLASQSASCACSNPDTATVSGSLQESGIAGASFRPAGVSGTTVSIVGTGLSTAVDGQGRFRLAGVPPGTRELELTGGVNGKVTLSDLKAGDTVEVSLSVQGSSVSVESTSKSGGSEAEVEGRVEALPASPAGSFVVAGKTVTTSASTTFTLNGGSGTFADVKIGVRVHVKGSPSGTAIAASAVKIQNTNADLPVEINGVVSSFSGNASAFSFNVGSRIVRGDSQTAFFGNSVFADLADGKRVEVKGQQRDGFVYASRIHVNKPDDDDDDDDDAGDLRGTISSIGGSTAPTTIVVAGRTVSVTAATEIRRRGDQYTLAVLRTGMAVEVSGATSGGTFTAKKVTIETEAFDVDVEGAIVGPLSGTCPARTFKIGSISFSTTSFTEFKKSGCSAVVVGARAKARGVLLPGGTSAEVGRLEFD
jgi:hypothetical protein